MSLEWSEVIPYAITIGTIVYTSGKLSGSFATKDALAALDNKIHAVITAKERESINEHKSLATKSSLTKIEGAMFSDIKELRFEMGERMKQLQDQYQDVLRALLNLDKHLMSRNVKKEETPNG